MSARFFARRSGGGAAGARGGLGRFGGVGRCLERGVGRGGDVRLGGLGCLFGSLGDRFVGAGCARQRGLHQGNSAFGAGGRILGELLDGFGDLFLVLRDLLFAELGQGGLERKWVGWGNGVVGR